MKKVWILEGFATREMMDKEMEELLKEIADVQTEVEKVAAKEIIKIHENAIRKYPEGRWAAYQGKTNYKQFCECAHETLRNMKKKNMQWRVIEGQIEDDAKYWVGYEPVKENPGVMRYLWATL